MANPDSIDGRSALDIVLKCYENSYVVVVVATRPLPKDWDMAEDYGAPEAGQLPRAWTKGRRETESPKS